MLERPGVDPDQVALLGASMGGLLAPRAAAYEHRLAACIAFDGVYDLGLTVTRSMPGTRAESEAVLRAESAPEADAMIDQLMASDPNIRWAATHGQYVMGVDSPRAFFASYLDYAVADGIAEQITCPTTQDYLRFAQMLANRGRRQYSCAVEHPVSRSTSSSNDGSAGHWA